MNQLVRQRSVLRFWIILGGLFLVIAVIAGFHTFSFGWPALVPWRPDTAASVMAGAGTVSAILFGLAQFGDQQIVQRSKHCLDAAMRGVERAHEVLGQDHEERNLVWVNAARLIQRSLRLATNLSEPDHIET
jgi:hypothetical protein